MRRHFRLSGFIESDKSSHLYHVALIIRLTSDVYNAGLLVFVGVEDISSRNTTLQLIRRQSGVGLTLLCRLRHSRQKTAIRESISLRPDLKGDAAAENKESAHGNDQSKERMLRSIVTPPAAAKLSESPFRTRGFHKRRAREVMNSACGLKKRNQKLYSAVRSSSFG